MLMLDGARGNGCSGIDCPMVISGPASSSVPIIVRSQEAAMAAATSRNCNAATNCRHRSGAPDLPRSVPPRPAPQQRRMLQALPAQIGCIYFAGDWCVPELPATLESAVLSESGLRPD